jgi:serine/threonine-protein kinase PpkA
MPRILVVDDEESIRKNIERLLTLEGYEVATAVNGQTALVIARSMLPDIVISDVNMPVMDGFTLLEAVRHHPDLERTIVIMLTAAETRENMRRGMRLGADDYLTKPFRREDLLESIRAQLKKLERIQRDKALAVEEAVSQAVAQTQSEDRTREMYVKRLAHQSGLTTPTPFGQSGIGLPMFGPPPSNSQSQPIPVATTIVTATVMFADIRSFTTMAERLSASELGDLLGQYFEQACQIAIDFGGTHLKILGDGLLVLFEEPSSLLNASHAQRASSAAMRLREMVKDFAQGVKLDFGARGLPDFEVGIGMHTGEVTLSELGSSANREITALGDAVNVASRLQTAGKELGWGVVISADTLQLAGPGVRRGREQLLTIRGRDQQVHACEMLAFASELDLKLSPEDAARTYNKIDIQNVAREASQATARAAKDALKQSLVSLQSGSFQAMPQHFKGYQVSTKLGEGGMSDVYLAYSAKQKQQVVLKVLRTAMSNDAEMLRRFIQEYAVLANLEHHHIAKIYDQGFTDEFAYIAMEHLAGGTLKDELDRAKGLGQTIDALRVVDLMLQITSALHTIHGLGLVYRDLKPENLMFRSTGELVLVDFGIVKSLREGDPDALVKTDHGQVIGTPYYVSPEQAAGKEITHRADFYSLGVLFYQLLTGERPYSGNTLQELLARHLYGEIPALPSTHAHFEPLLHQLMAKDPNARPQDASDIWLTLKQLHSALKPA